MKKIMLLVVLSMTVSLFAQNDKLYIKKSIKQGITKTKNEENTNKKLLLVNENGTPEIYIYENTLNFNNNKIYVWLSTEYYVEQDTISVDVLDNELGIMYNTIKEYYVFDINKNMYSILSKEYIDCNTGNTKKKIKQNEYTAEWEYITPESKYEVILEILLEYKNNN